MPKSYEESFSRLQSEAHNNKFNVERVLMLKKGDKVKIKDNNKGIFKQYIGLTGVVTRIYCDNHAVVEVEDGSLLMGLKRDFEKIDVWSVS